LPFDDDMNEILILDLQKTEDMKKIKGLGKVEIWERGNQEREEVIRR